jgi:hypothetical protein
VPDLQCNSAGAIVCAASGTIQVAGGDCCCGGPPETITVSEWIATGTDVMIVVFSENMVSFGAPGDYQCQGVAGTAFTSSGGATVHVQVPGITTASGDPCGLLSNAGMVGISGNAVVFPQTSHLL